MIKKRNNKKIILNAGKSLSNYQLEDGLFWEDLYLHLVDGRCYLEDSRHGGFFLTDGNYSDVIERLKDGKKIEFFRCHPEVEKEIKEILGVD